MPRPLALCLEDLDARPGDPEFLRCVALAGGEPGLTLRDGQVAWQDPEGADAEFWISLDERLILRRREGGRAARVVRAGRTLEVPASKPVVLRDQDELVFGPPGGRRFRVHVHGEARVVHPPQPLLRKAWAPLAAAAMLGAAGLGCPSTAATGTGPAGKVEPPPIEVRDMPPSPVEAPEVGDAGAPGDSELVPEPSR